VQRHPRSYPHAPVDDAQGRAQISAAMPEAFVRWRVDELSASFEIDKAINNDIIEVKCVVSHTYVFLY
jgi:hypothetical protein